MLAVVKKSIQSAPRPLDPNYLRNLICTFPPTDTPPVILCIGTDRIIGDCLGPMVGTILEKEAGEKLTVYGTLRKTVHALNLPDVILQIKKKHPGRLVIAVDASLGSPENIGVVFVRPWGLKPGAGVSKDLPVAGDISITGIVGHESCRPYLDLQTARLSTIAAMADDICGCLLNVCLGQSGQARINFPTPLS